MVLISMWLIGESLLICAYRRGCLKLYCCALSKVLSLPPDALIDFLLVFGLCREILGGSFTTTKLSWLASCTNSGSFLKEFLWLGSRIEAPTIFGTGLLPLLFTVDNACFSVTFCFRSPIALTSFDTA